MDACGCEEHRMTSLIFIHISDLTMYKGIHAYIFISQDKYMYV